MPAIVLDCYFYKVAIRDLEASVAKLADQINRNWVKRFRDEHSIT